MTSPASVDDNGLAEVYRDLHEHPELSFQETRTAAIVAARLVELGFETTAGVGGTGVVGILHNGVGATALLRADMDALPVQEQTGLSYASTARATDADGIDGPVMHACGHDVHVTCLLGACAELAATPTTWSGTLMVVFQPAEELGKGAQAMIADGLYERFPIPAVVLGQHVAPFPAGFLALRTGVAFAGVDSVRITLYGRGGHGSRPEVTIDPVVMAASTVMRLQTIVSRKIAGTDMAVVTVGVIRAGTKENIIPDDAELLLSIRTFDSDVRTQVLDAIKRIVAGEALAAGATREPEVELIHGFPAVVNDGPAISRLRSAFTTLLGDGRVFDPGVVTGSEDVGLLAEAAGAPCAFWLLGGSDPRLFEGASTADEITEITKGLPSNHSPHYAPVIEPTVGTGVAALVTAARTWLPAPGQS